MHPTTIGIISTFLACQRIFISLLAGLYISEVFQLVYQQCLNRLARQCQLMNLFRLISQPRRCLVCCCGFHYPSGLKNPRVLSFSSTHLGWCSYQLTSVSTKPYFFRSIACTYLAKSLCRFKYLIADNTLRYTHWWCGRWFHDQFCTPCRCPYRLFCSCVSACSVCWRLVLELHKWWHL